ncbi:hypothetical protein DLM45_13445 [Hyphomicrobium methylovorum]|uniref:hypothetical protein n=1 Tax=Hyphomicrobium methylovorum TaxID=84 RepID=UPI0015E6B862|nr:hypothetical protein [Hyphomicrobium methylovorum]MBA2127219.1 hypothetical protein [Hyphomicrobium methylovorum]
MAAPKKRAPLNPYLVLLVAAVLPGAGHVIAGKPYRGLGFALFALLIGGYTWITTTPEHSFIGRISGGIFVWAMSLPDAYQIARMRYEVWKQDMRAKG